MLEEIADRATLATVQGNLATLCLRTGDDTAAEAHLRRSAALFDELGLDTHGARATRDMLTLGLTKGWDAARQRFAQDGMSPPRQLDLLELRRSIMIAIGEETGPIRRTTSHS